jgi:hypothetical protein
MFLGLQFSAVAWVCCWLQRHPDYFSRNLFNIGELAFYI